MADNNSSISFAGPGQATSAHVKPGEVIVFDNVDFDAIKIDILGPDVILTNLDTSAKIFLPGLGLILFSSEDAPTIQLSDGSEITPQELLSKVGSIQNVTQEDFLTFTSLDLNPEQGADDLNLAGLEDNSENEELLGQLEEQQKKIEEQQRQIEAKEQEIDAQKDVLDQKEKQIEEQTEEFFDIASKLEDFTSQSDSDGGGSLASDAKNSETTPNDDAVEAIESSRADFVKDATGALTSPPTTPSAPGTPEQTTEENEDVSDGTVTAAAQLDFQASLLQLSLVDDLAGSATITGGGSSEAGAFDARNEAQFSTETIDTTAETIDHTIRVDDPAFFGTAMLSRVLQISPAIPLGFGLDNVTVSGLPNDFQIDGLTADGNGDYILLAPTLDANNNIELIISYPVPNTQSFTLTLSSTATFDPLSGLPIPDEATQTFELIQQVEVRDVNSPADGNFTDAMGDDVWVFSNNANGNRVFTGDGNVTVIGGEGDDQVSSGAGDDIIQAAGGDDIISSDEGNDTVRGGLGSDRINGGDGIDTADFSDITDDIVLDLSDDGPDADGFFEATISNGDIDELINFENVIAGTGDDQITGDANDNEIQGGDGNDQLNGNAGNDTLIGGEGNDVFVGEVGNDVLTGGNGNDTIDYSYATGGITVDLTTTSVTVVGGTDVDTISSIENVITTDGNDIVTGTSGNNVLTTNAGTDTISAGAGNDNINAGSGNDIINAGSGNDTIDAGTGADTITASVGNDTIDGGGDVDTLSYSAFTNGISVTIDDVAGFATLTSGAETDMIRNIERITGTNQMDSITGDASSETFRGNAGDDVIDGALGDDTIHGGLGNDTLTGGAGGTDTLRFDDLTGVGISNLNITAGTADFTNGDQDIFGGFEIYRLTNSADTVNLSAGDDTVFGNSGNDVFNASTGDDTIDGGGNTDLLNYGAAVTNLVVDLNLTIGTVTGFGTDNLTSIENLITGSGNDTITGNGSANNITAGAGDDTVQGRGGNDFLDGGTQTTADVLSYTYTNSAVTYNLTDLDAGGYFRITIGAETDRARNFEEIQGSGGTDTFTGDTNDNSFFGNNGNDIVNASLGDDTYSGGNGTNILNYSNAAFDTHGLTVDLGAVNGGGFSTVSFVGLTEVHLIQNFTEINGSDDIDDIRGTASNETFRGNGGADTLRGFGGNDILEGDNGVDTLFGGDGNDTLRGEGTAGDQLFGEAGNDTLFADNTGGDTLNGGTNTDTVSYASVTGGITVTLVAGGATDNDGNILVGIENITGTSAGDVITGDVSVNVINGGSGADTLDGGGGNDNINGGTGNDIFIAGAGNDTFNGSTNTDTVNYSAVGASVDVDLGGTTASDDGQGGVDTLISIENVIGTDFDDTITGSNTANVLTGGLGIDTLNGGGGNDTLNGDDGNDIFISSDGNDVINGGADVDIVDYSGELSSITLDSPTNTIFKDSSADTDTLNDIEMINGSDFEDIFNFDTTDLANFTSIDANGGVDRLNLDGFIANDGSQDGDDLASIFSDIEEIDFSNTALLGGDNFDLSADDVKALTDTNDFLHVEVEAGFNLNVLNGTFALTSDNTVGNTRTYTFDNAGDAVTLEVETVVA